MVVAADGTPIGLASHARRFYGQSVVWGGLSLRYLPAVLLDSAIHLLERPPSHLGIKSAYAQDELVTLTFTITNTSDWPVTWDYMPPTVTIYSIQEVRDVAVLRYGDGHRVLQPGETSSFTMTWDQVHFEGGRATPGRYVAKVHLANLANNWYLSPGPTAYELILE